MTERNGQHAAGVNALNATEGVLTKFWDLASLDQEVRNSAACALVEDLMTSQKQHEVENEIEEDAALNGDVENGKKRAVEHALRRCSPLMAYGLKRLVKGLASGRQGARQGFALALTLLLSQAENSITAQEALAVINSTLETSSSAKGSEARDALLGALFGMGAIVRSSLELDVAAGCELATALVQIAEKKWFFKEAAVSVLLELLERMDSKTIGEVLRSVEGLKAWLTASPSSSSSSPETLLLSLRLWPQLPPQLLPLSGLLPSGCHPPPETVFSKATPAAGKAAAPAASAFFSPEHLQHLLPLLLDTTRSHPHLHSLWPTLLALLIPGFNPNKEQRQSETGANNSPQLANLETFWGLVVEAQLFTSSHERKYLGFMLLAILLPHLKSQHVPVVFTPNFLRCLSNNLSKQDSYLHSTAKKCLDRISSFAEKSFSGTRIAVTLALKRQGGILFEKFNKVHKAGSTLEALSGKALQQQALDLQQTFNSAQEGSSNLPEDEEMHAEDEEMHAEDEGTTQAYPPAQQQWAVEQLCALCKLPSADTEDKLSVLRFLALHACLRLDPEGVKKLKDKQLWAAAECSTRLSPATRQLCASRVITLADSLSKAGGSKGLQQKEHGPGKESSQGERCDFVVHILDFVESTSARGAGVRVSADTSNTAAQSLAALTSLRSAVANRLKGSGSIGTEQGRLRSLQHLSNAMTLQLLGDPDALDHSLPQDLLHCYNQAFEGRVGGSSQMISDKTQSPPHWMDSMLDVLLSLLAHSSPRLPSAPLREAVEHVFRTFCDELTPTGMEDILRVIVRPVETGGGGDDEDEVLEDVDRDDNPAQERDALSESSDDAAGSETDGEHEDDESSEGSSEGDDVDAEFKGLEKNQGGSSEEDEDDLDEEAMFRMDAKLAAYFSALRESKKGTKAQVEELLNFKMRVTALLDVFIRKAPGNSLLPSTVLPLLSTLVSCTGNRGGVHQALAQRLAGILQNKLARSKPEVAGAAGCMNEEQLASALRRCLYLASRSGDKMVIQAAGAAYQYLLRVAAGSGGGVEKSPAAMGSVIAALADLCTKKKTRLGLQFFEGLIRRPLSLGPVLLPPLLGYAASARTKYVQAQAQALLQQIVKVRSPEICAAAAKHSGSGASLVAHVVKQHPSKQPRHVEALRMACMLLECITQAEDASCAKHGYLVREAVSSELNAVPPPAPKVAAQLKKLADLALLLEGSASLGLHDDVTVKKPKKLKRK